MATSTREKLIQAGIDLFYQHGFHAIGLDRVLQQVGVTKTTFYNHFESKEDLVREVIERHEANMRDRMRSGVERFGRGNPREKLLAVFDVLHELFTEGSFRGCLLINALVEFPAPNDQIHATAQENKRVMNGFFRELAEATGVKDPAAFAEEFAMLVDGAILARQTLPDPLAARKARQMAEKLLVAALENPGPSVREPAQPVQNRA